MATIINGVAYLKEGETFRKGKPKMSWEEFKRFNKDGKWSKRIDQLRNQGKIKKVK